MIGREAVDAGLVHEAEATALLTELGWAVVPFGQGTWNPNECPIGNADLLAAVRAAEGALRHAPDLLVGRGSEVRLVEVVHCAGHTHRCLEVAKLAAGDRWATIAPVYGLDTSDWHAWRHTYRWPYTIVDGPMRYTRTGSGDPFVWVTRDGDRPVTEVFR